MKTRMMISRLDRLCSLSDTLGGMNMHECKSYMLLLDVIMILGHEL